MTGITSLLAPVSDHRVHRLVEEFGIGGHPVRFVEGTWDERLAALRSGDAVGTWVCGLLHVESTARGDWPFRAVAAPASARPGSQGTAVYFGDVVVRLDAPYGSFEELRGSTFAYNEESSLSGHRMMIDHLRSRGEDFEFFGSTRRSGSHRASLDMVLDGEADCAMLDSTLVDDGIAGVDRVRRVSSIGPYPAPPLVVSAAWRDVTAAAALAAGWLAVDDEDYLPLLPT